jgi:hypothetical protein
MEFGRRAKACYTNQVVAALFEELPPHPAKSFDSGRPPAQKLQLKFALRPDSSVVERGPEKAGVGGSIPSLATTHFTFHSEPRSGFSERSSVVWPAALKRPFVSAVQYRLWHKLYQITYRFIGPPFHSN